MEPKHPVSLCHLLWDFPSTEFPDIQGSQRLEKPFEQSARSSSKVRAHSSVKSLERDEVSVAAVSLLTWKQWEQGWRPLDQELASFCWRMCLRVSELCHLSGSPHLEYSVPSTEMVCPGLGDHKRTEKWANLGPVHEE